MGLNVGTKDYCHVSCDDPYARGCVGKTESMYGQLEMAEFACQQGWFKDDTTGKWTCPPCITNENHDVRSDSVGPNTRSRFTCYTPACCGATLVAQPYMTSEIWEKKYGEFSRAHPAQEIKSEGWRG